MQPLGSCAGVVLVLYELLRCTVADHILNSFGGTVGGGNYSYYKLPHQGYVRLILQTVTGDADLYLSTMNARPTFDDYDFQATTCGEDIVDLPPIAARPIVIGVYGYPMHETSKYILHVMIVTDYDQGYPEELSRSEFFTSEFTKTNHRQTQKNLGAPAKDEEESILWTIFVGILKILFDILM